MTQETKPAPQGDLFLQPEVVDTPEALAALLPELRAAPWLALDTEFTRERTYYARLCLIQIATPDETVHCIDPLALDPTPLAAILSDPAITKVFHAAGQDLEILNRAFGAPPSPVFDTQIAATALGLGEQIGYARLVETRLGIQLEKGHSRADWSRRPLTPALLEYAIDDVRYLARLYPDLRAELEAHDGHEWAAGEHRRLADPEAYVNDPVDAWRRLRPRPPLDGPGRGILQALAAWREREARRRDLPRGWVVNDALLLDIARRRPTTPEAVATRRGAAKLDPGTVAALAGLVAEVLEQPPEEWPAAPVRAAARPRDPVS
ncbi:MAG: ribonuclease D [Pseudomonadota bacterium]